MGPRSRTPPNHRPAHRPAARRPRSTHRSRHTGGDVTHSGHDPEQLDDPRAVHIDLIAADAGLDTADYTFAYVAGWAADTGDVDAALRVSAGRVLATAHQVLEATAAEPAAPEPAAADQLAAATADLAARTGAGAARTAGAVEDVTGPALTGGPDRWR